MSQHYMDGRWYHQNKMQLSVFDLALTRGIAVFDTLRTFNCKPFELQRHLVRFRNAASTLGIQLSHSDSQIRDIIDQGIERNSFDECVIRLNLTGGINEGMLQSSKPSFYVLFLPLSLPAQEKYQTGQTLASFYIERTLPQIKTINYVSAKIALVHAQQKGADEAMYIDKDENILETTISNIFFVEDESLITPPGENILAGVTRQVILELAAQNNIDVIQRNIQLNELPRFSESFACSSIKGILPVVKIDDVTVGAGLPGEMTQKMMSLYQNHTSSQQ